MAELTPPNATLESRGTGGYPQRPVAVPAGRGFEWWSEAWRLFTAAPWVWIAITLIACVVMMMAAFIPILGTVATSFLGPVFAGGILLGARELDHGGELRIEHLFVGFSERLMPLLVVGLLYLAGSVVIVLVVGVGLLFAVGFSGIGALMSGDPLHMGLAMLTGFGVGALLALLVGALLGIPLMMAFWFAPALVVFRNDDPLGAMGTSFKACLIAWLPLLVYGLVGFVLGMLASIPFLLGWLVLGPVFAASVYTSYKDIFGDPA